MHTLTFLVKRSLTYHTTALKFASRAKALFYNLDIFWKPIFRLLYILFVFMIFPRMNNQEKYQILLNQYLKRCSITKRHFLHGELSLGGSFDFAGESLIVRKCMQRRSVRFGAIVLETIAI